MSIFLVYAYLFFIGSVGGWILEVFFRKFFSKSNPNHKWINPGFCEGPYLPLYGWGLCTLYFISDVSSNYQLPIWLTIIVIIFCMTLIEYFAGLVSVKIYKIKLWDYSHLWGNIQGIICPVFSLAWGIMGGVYYFFVNPFILNTLIWLSNNLAFSFFIGFFFGVFFLDTAHSTNIANKLRKFAKEHDMVVIMDTAKAHIRKFNDEHNLKHYFLRPFKSEFSISEILKHFIISNKNK